MLVQEDRSAPAVAVVTHVKAGFFDEPDHWAGVSHVLEHMFFKGTPRRGVGAIARETKSAGGYLNASTTYDHTTYFTVLPASGLEAALDIQSDALRHSLIDADELARELQVIIQEAKRKLDTPSALTHETLHEVMFDRHRIRRWRIGHESQLAGYTRGDLQGYYASRYVPERTIVSIVGAVDPGHALTLARDAYGDWPAAAGAVDRSPDEPPRHEVRARTLRGDVARAELAVGWRTVAALHHDSPALDLVAAVLGSGKGSRLYRRLREPGIVSWVSAHHYAPTELGVMSVSAEVAPGRVEEALAGIAESVTQLALLGPSRLDLDRARTLLRARWARRMESMEGRAASLAEAEALDGFELLDREYAASKQSSPMRCARRRSGICIRTRCRACSICRARRATTSPGRRSREYLPSRRSHRRGSWRRYGPGRGLRVRCNRAAKDTSWHTPLPGVDLLVWHKPGVPLATVGIYVPRSRLDPAEQAGIGALTARSATRGAAGLDAGGLAFAFEGLGGTLGASAASDWLGFGTTVLAEHLGEAAALLESVFSEPHLDDASVELERETMVAEAEQVTDDMFRYPFQLAFAEGFGADGYGLPVAGLPGTLSAISGADVRAWHQRAFREVRPVVVAVGDLDPSHASELLAGAFGTQGDIPPHPDADPARLGGKARRERRESCRAQRARTGGARDGVSRPFTPARRPRRGGGVGGGGQRAGWQTVRGPARPPVTRLHGDRFDLAEGTRRRAARLHRHVAGA